LVAFYIYKNLFLNTEFHSGQVVTPKYENVHFQILFHNCDFIPDKFLFIEDTRYLSSGKESVTQEVVVYPSFTNKSFTDKSISLPWLLTIILCCAYTCWELEVLVFCMHILRILTVLNKTSYHVNIL